MSFRFSSVKPSASAPKLVDPIGLFQTLKTSDPSVNDLWLAQGDALREWHAVRADLDVAIALNTGAGKTLVGLLVAQSLVNETHSLVIYACSSIQLVRQTAAKAHGYGLASTTYLKHAFNNDLASSGKAPCITTYQALFNGRTVFASRDITAIIFDDSHVAEHMLREHFTLHIGRNSFDSLYRQLAAHFADYFRSVSRAGTYSDIVEHATNGSLLVSPSEVRRNHAQILQQLQAADVANRPETFSAWAHLRDHLDMCGFIISSSEIAITPPFVPVSSLPFFGQGIRRVYLSATLNADDVFARTFGRAPTHRVSPVTTAGECERMVLVPSCVIDGGPDVSAAQEMTKNLKTLLLVPTYARGSVWQDVAEPPNRDRVDTAVEEFKSATGPAKLLLTARYDGMDLPGDTCRSIIIDDLPSGTGPLERFQWESLGLHNTLRSTVACRIAQSFGRISRGMSDHGVAVLTGKRLIEWLQTPRNREALPVFLRKQLMLGFQMSGDMARSDMLAAPSACLDRNAEWLAAYEAYMRDAPVSVAYTDRTASEKLALAEARYAEAMWSRNYAKAARSLQDVMEIAGDFSATTAGWYALWIGCALELQGDSAEAVRLYRRASSAHRNLPRIRPSMSGSDVDMSSQVANIVRLFEVDSSGRVCVPESLDADISCLNSSSTANQVEESLRKLGEYLGVISIRPDKEYGTGPDVLWYESGGKALCMEAKTEKAEATVYRKVDLGQLADHVEWVRQNTDAGEITAVFVGPERPASPSANPAPGVKVAHIDKFRALAHSLTAVYLDIASTSSTATLAHTTEECLDRCTMRWPTVLGSLSMIELRDMISV